MKAEKRGAKGYLAAITTRITGPRNTVAYVQTVLAP